MTYLPVQREHDQDEPVQQQNRPEDWYVTEGKEGHHESDCESSRRQHPAQ